MHINPSVPSIIIQSHRYPSMKTQSRDSTVQSERMQISLLRGKNAAQKFSLIRALSQSTVQSSKRAIARANRGFDENQVNVFFVDLHYGKELAKRFMEYLDESHENT